MELSQVFKLLDAGFTKAEIMAMTADPLPSPAPVPAPASTPDAGADPDPAPTPDPDPTPAPVPAQDPAMAAMAAQIQSLTQAVQRNNILNSQQPPQTAETVDTILAQIINPTYKKEV